MHVWSASTSADRVRPKDSVITGVHVHAEASGDSQSLTLLRPNKSLLYDSSVLGWHRFLLEDSRAGFVRKRWTEIISNTFASTAIQFAVHFIDVGTGDSAIIDMGDREIVIDGGNSTKVLNEYANRKYIIDSPIELVVVTHGDTDHWNGLRRLLGFDGKVTNPPTVKEFWEPGYNRDCNLASNTARPKYIQFIKDVQGIVAREGFRRPLQTHHTPAVISGTPQPFTLASFPGVVLPIVRPTRSRLNRMFDNILRGLVVEIRTQHSALRYASGGMLGQSEDFQIYFHKWYRSPSHQVKFQRAELLVEDMVGMEGKNSNFC